MIVPNKSELLLSETKSFLGDFHLLMKQIGSAPANDFQPLLPSLDSVKDVASLKIFLVDYRDRILIPVELPSIYQAYLHASRNEVRELVALDQRLVLEARLQLFASASQRVGRTHLKRLKPLRDQRVAKRYLESVESKKSLGWHTLVYGLTLAIYSLPMRQGLATYAEQTLRGFIEAGARRLHLSEIESQNLLSDLLRDLPKTFEQLIASDLSPRNLAA